MSRVDVDHPTRTLVLLPGQWCLREGEGRIETLLGSCVAVTIWDPLTTTSACCHYVLPGQAIDCRTVAEPGKYGSCVIPAMWKALATRGIPKERCVHKVFGGGRMFDSDIGDIGAENIRLAHSALRNAGIAITAESVGDNGHRRIAFDVASGEVRVQFTPIDGGPMREARS